MANRIESANNFLDLNGLNSIRQQSKSDDSADKKAALEQVAKQFEGIFMQMLLKSMRSAQDVLESDSPLNSESTKFYRDMHDQQMALELSSKGSLGLKDLIVRQLGGDSENFTPRSVLRNDGQIPAKTPERHKKLTASADMTDALVSNNRQVSAVNEINKAIAVAPPTFTSPADFVTAMSAPAKLAQQEIGVPFEVIIAQAALETGWGQKIIKTASGNSSNNLFNIKADARWQGDSTTKETLEFEQGAMVKKSAPFRVYQSITDSVNDYINFLSANDRYQPALQQGGNVEHFLQGIQQAGYATDPQYANKVLATLGKVTGLLNN